MQTMIASYMLPAMQVVCHLVVSGVPDASVTTSVPLIVTATAQQQGILTTVPDGYVAYGDDGFAYKFHEQVTTWKEARRRCLLDGAELALIDSVEKMEFVKREKASWISSHVGIIRMYDDEKTWVAIGTGAEIPVSSLPCRQCDLHSGGDCLQIRFSDLKLVQYSCSSTANYICETQIIENKTITMPIN